MTGAAAPSRDTESRSEKALELGAHFRATSPHARWKADGVRSEVELLIFETHPIQYRAPIYQALQTLCPDRFEVVYASDFSVKGYRDEGFGANLSWDVPLLDGYPHRVLGNDAPGGINRWSGLTGRGVYGLLRKLRPKAVLLQSFGYRFSWAAYGAALWLGIPIWIRMETQDQARTRSPLKSWVRRWVYRLAYTPVRRAFYIGQLNREHLLKHGVRESRLRAAHYCTPNPLKDVSAAVKQHRRSGARAVLGIPPHHHVLAFFGKLIPKKDPALLLMALQQSPHWQGQPITVLYVGTGELETELRQTAEALRQSHGIQTHFAGFVNQSRLPDLYLASDVVVLPSRQAGETWGLVVNEAMHAGCSVIVSRGVGCHRDFQNWPRVRTIAIGDATALSAAASELFAIDRDFDWANSGLQDYAVEQVARAYHAEIQALAGLPQ